MMEVNIAEYRHIRLVYRFENLEMAAFFTALVFWVLTMVMPMMETMSEWIMLLVSSLMLVFAWNVFCCILDTPTSFRVWMRCVYGLHDFKVFEVRTIPRNRMTLSEIDSFDEDGEWLPEPGTYPACWRWLYKVKHTICGWEVPDYEGNPVQWGVMTVRKDGAIGLYDMDGRPIRPALVDMRDVIRGRRWTVFERIWPWATGAILALLIMMLTPLRLGRDDMLSGLTVPVVLICLLIVVIMGCVCRRGYLDVVDSMPTLAERTAERLGVSLVSYEPDSGEYRWILPDGSTGSGKFYRQFGRAGFRNVDGTWCRTGLGTVRT